MESTTPLTKSRSDILGIIHDEDTTNVGGIFSTIDGKG